MTNMQHYMDDIHDLLDGLDGEMKKRMERMSKWDNQITKYADEIRRIEDFVCNTSIPLEQREYKLRRLAELKGLQRDLAEQKTELADRNQMTVQAVYAKLNELAYHCKCEVEIDNPGCTERREKLFLLSLQSPENNCDEPGFSSLVPSSKRSREMSSMTDDDRNSTRSGTPFGKEIRKKIKAGPGRPRNVQKGKHSSAYSSTRSSVEHDSGKNVKKLSKYMLKKQEAAEERARIMSMDIKKEFEVGDFDALENDQWSAAECNNGRNGGHEEEDEQELLNCLFISDIGGIGSPPKGMLEALDVNETGLYGMEMYPPNQNFIDKTDLTDSMSSDAYNFQSPSANYSSISKKTNAATSSSSGELVEKRKRNMLFGSIAETSFSGRPRKLTDRVTEMIQSNREKEIRQKMKRESDEWCFCSGENTKSDMMVGCDNNNCRIVWFHFDCVGLTEDPQNEWYCPECRVIFEKQDSPELFDT